VEVLTLVALVLAVLALLAVAVVLGQVRSLRAQPQTDVDGVPADVLGLRQEVAALRAEAAGALRHLAVVRYDAFGDASGRLSWSIVLADDSGDGLLMTSIHARSEGRTYVKSLHGWTCDQEMSTEESEAVAHARP